MGVPSQADITNTAERPRETWDDPVRGKVSWYTLFSSDAEFLTAYSVANAWFAKLISMTIAG